MIKQQNSYIYYWILMLVTTIVTSIIVSCSHNSAVDRQLMVAVNLMEEHPDSALSFLKEIDAGQFGSKADKARYALLMSMALDKNYIDTTTFDVLQPAIDYYLDKGSPDDRLKTLYYQGRIFQNNENYDQAMLSFIKAREVNEILDSLTLARVLVAQGTLYFRQYKLDSFIANNLEAAKIYENIGNEKYALRQYCNALDGCDMLHDRNKADSIFKICTNLIARRPEFSESFADSYLSYTISFGTPEEIRTVIDEVQQDNAPDQLTIANGYLKIGDYKGALICINNANIGDTKADTLHYLSIKTKALELSNQFEEALASYKKYNNALEEYHYDLFTQDLLFAEEHHNLELAALKEKNHKERIIGISCGIVLILCVILLIYRTHLKSLKAKHNSDLMKIQTLQSYLFESSQKQKNITKKIEELFSSRFSVVDELATSYFECKETGQEQKRIYAEVKEKLNNFGSESSTQELENIVNAYNDNLMGQFKEDYPKLSVAQYRLALYLFCGFSLPSISIFTGSDLRNIYVYKSRLKGVISKSESPNKNSYLAYF